MPRRSKGARLWLRPARRDERERVTHPAVWLIRDGAHQESTGCGRDDLERAEQKLAAYIAEKHVAATTRSLREPAQIPVADVVALYAKVVAPTHARPKESAKRLG